MYKIIRDLLKDHKGGATFNCFDIWHLLYILLVCIIITYLIIKMKNKSESTRKNLVRYSINIAFGLYIY